MYTQNDFKPSTPAFEYMLKIPQLGIHYLSLPNLEDAVQVSSSKTAHEIFRAFMCDEAMYHHEIMAMLTLSSANKVLGYHHISTGGLSGTVADLRIIAQTALLTSAVSLILCHNHPSGNLKASHADLNLTKRASEGLKNLDIKILDHLILSPNGAYMSMADEGLL